MKRMAGTLSAESGRGGKLVLIASAVLILVFLAWLSGEWKQAGSFHGLAASWRNRPFGPLWCMALQALQVVLFFIPGEAISFAAGYVFGTWHALAYSMVGIMLGSAFNFHLARTLGRPLLTRIVKPSSLERADRLLVGAKGRLGIFLVFLFPFGPKDAFCYGAAFSGMSLAEFTAISGAARFPALLFSVYLGTSTAHRNFVLLATAGLVALATGGAFYLFRRHRAVRKLSTPVAKSQSVYSSAGAVSRFSHGDARCPIFEQIPIGQGRESSPAP